jgi:hypothetical protein
MDFSMSDDKKVEKRVDTAVDMTFPASDPTAHQPPTSTEPPGRPADRTAPVITKVRKRNASGISLESSPLRSAIASTVSPGFKMHEQA